MAVILSLTLCAANILKVVIPSTTRGMDSETGDQCGDVMLSVICDNTVNQSLIAKLSLSGVLLLYNVAVNSLCVFVMVLFVFFLHSVL